jgi:hypothetical protein
MPKGIGRPLTRTKRDAIRNASPQMKENLIKYADEDRNFRGLMARTENTLVDAGIAGRTGHPGSPFASRKIKEQLPAKFNKGGMITNKSMKLDRGQVAKTNMSLNDYAKLGMK